MSQCVFIEEALLVPEGVLGRVLLLPVLPLGKTRARIACFSMLSYQVLFGIVWIHGVGYQLGSKIGSPPSNPLNRTLEELDLLFTPQRRVLVCFDKEACKKGSMLKHGLDLDPATVAKDLESALVLGAIRDHGDVKEVALHDEYVAEE